MVRTLVARVCFAFPLLRRSRIYRTYLGFDPMTPFPALWMMHVAAMAALASTLLSGNVRLLPRGSSVLDLWSVAAFHEGASDAAGSAFADENEFVRVVRPNRRKLIAGALVAYALVNFFVCLSILQGGQPAQREGQWCLNRTARWWPA